MQTLAALPDNAGVFTGGNLAAVQAALTAQNANNALSNPVTSANLDPQILQYVSFPLTLAQILALHGTPITIVAAQGAGTLIEVVSAVLNLVYGSAAYAGGGVVSLNYGNTANLAVTAGIAAAVFTGLGANEIETMTGPVTLASSVCLNQPLVLLAATANFTVGTGGSATLKVAYRVHSGLA